MKRLFFIVLCIWSVALVKGQRLTYEYSYDNAGNRVRRAIVRLGNRNGNGISNDTLLNPLNDVIDSGLTMTLFPNPTKETVRFDLGGDGRIGRYVLTDMSGRHITEGTCGTQSLTIDLSAESEGMYFLELFIEGKPRVYKVIKQ